MQAVLNLKPTASTHNSHRMAWVVVMTTALFFFYEFVQLNVFNSIGHQIMQEFNLDAVELGNLAAMYFYANAIFVFPAGNLLDRYSTKKLLLFAVALCTLGSFMFSLAATYLIAAVGRFIVGIGASFCFLSSIRIASRWFPPQRMAFVTGVIVVMAMLGGLAAQTPFALLINFVGDWRTAMLINASLGILLFIAIMIIVQDWPPNARAQQQHDIKQIGLWPCIKIAAFNPQNWLGGVYTSLMNLPVFLLGALWGINYLQTVHHISFVQASYATTMFFFGVIFGSPIFGWFSDWLERRVLPMIVGAILSIAVIFILMFVPNLSLTSLILLFFLIGFVTSSQVLTYPTVAELNPVYLTSTAVSIESICIMVSGFIFQPFFGWVMQWGSAPVHINGALVYTAESFNRAMWILPISFIIALILSLLIKETYCKSQA